MTAKRSVASNQRFGRWTYGNAEKVVNGRRSLKVKCDCGTERYVQASDLFSGKSTQCKACAQRTHDMSRSPEYKAWQRMIRRCYSQNHISYVAYGARGVRVCDRWNPAQGGSFENFLADVGPRPGPSYSLDKEAVAIENMVYSPETTAWVPHTENLKRRKANLRYPCQGQLLTISEIASICGINRQKAYTSLRVKGIPVEALVAKHRVQP